MRPGAKRDFRVIKLKLAVIAYGGIIDADIGVRGVKQHRSAVLCRKL